MSPQIKKDFIDFMKENYDYFVEKKDFQPEKYKFDQRYRGAEDGYQHSIIFKNINCTDKQYDIEIVHWRGDVSVDFFESANTVTEKIKRGFENFFLGKDTFQADTPEKEQFLQDLLNEIKSDAIEYRTKKDTTLNIQGKRGFLIGKSECCHTQKNKC